MTTFALYNNKGGVGKTAAAVNLSYLAAQCGYKTLLCDLDPQCASTFYFKVKPLLKKSTRGFTKVGKAISKSIQATDYEGLHLLPADFTHRNLDITFHDMGYAEGRLQRVLQPLQESYDLVFLDCPPTINILAENIFQAVDHLLVPLIPTTLSLRTHAQLLAFLQAVEMDVHIVYPFLSMVDGRKKMHKEMTAAVYEKYPSALQTIIPYLSIVEQMGVQRRPVPAFAPRSRAAQAYSDLWGEIQQEILKV